MRGLERVLNVNGERFCIRGVRGFERVSERVG